MTRRRSPPPDGYQLKDNTSRFIVIREMWREVISSEPLPPDTDLRTAANEVQHRMAAAGWNVEDLGKYNPCFYASKSGKRVEVSIETDPFERKSPFF